MATNKDKIRAAAQKFLQKGQLDRAIREYARLVEEDPKDVRTLLKIGDLQTRAGQHLEATDTYGRVAQFYSEQGFFLKAVAVYKQILKLQPGLVETNRRLAELYHQLGLVSDATNQYRQIAQLYEKEGRLDESLDVLRRMVELDPENVASRIKLAELFAKQGMVEEARDEFHRAAVFLKSQHRIDDYAKVAERIIHFDPSDLETSRELANIYIQKGDPRRALAKLQVCFRSDPRHIDTLTLLADAFRELGQTAKTLSVLRELLRLHQEAGRTDAASRVARRILQIVPDDAKALELAGGAEAPALVPEAPSAAAAIGRIVPNQVQIRPPVEVREVNPHASASTPEVAGPSVALTAAANDIAAGGDAPPHASGEQVAKLLVETDIYMKYGLRAKAIDHLRRILELDPSLREARLKHCQLLIESGERDAAANELLAMANTARSLGELDQARADLERLLGLVPGHPEARALLGRLGVPTFEPAAPPPAMVEIDVVADGADDLEPDAHQALPTDIEVEVEAPRASWDVAVEVDGEDSAPAPEATTPDVDEVTPSDTPPAVAALLSTGDHERIEIDVDAPALEMDAAPTPALEPEPEPEPELAPGPMAPRVPEAAAPLAPGPLASPAIDVAITAITPAIPSAHAPVAAVASAPLDAASPSSPVAAPVEAAPAHLDLDEEIHEVGFFLEQGLEDEARESLERLLALHPEHAGLLALQARMAGPPPPEAPPFEPDEVLEMSVDLESEVGAELDEAAQNDDFQISFHDVFEEFKRGVAEQIEESDHDTHYDLGIAYREMGLLGDAIREFGLALGSPERHIGALTLIGLCWLQQGRADEALVHFQRGLAAAQVSPAEAMALRFEIAGAHEALGQRDEALRSLEAVHALDPTFRDVAGRLARLRAGGTPPSPPGLDAALGNGAGPAQHKISYL